MRSLGLAAALLASAAAPVRADISGREARCLTMIAYTEAAVDGARGMDAVIRVVRNRMADPRFPDDACAVILQVAQFQPIAQSALLQKVASDPEGYSIPQMLGLRDAGSRRLLAEAHRLATAKLTKPDPTGGALYFVNPKLMDPAHCPWFAGLERTAAIGSHVFLTDRVRGQTHGSPALDCAAGRDVSSP